MSAYEAEPWHDFAVATASASAALVGLLFVAISINLRLILSLPRVPERALHALLLLATPLLLSLVLLIPQGAVALAVELLVVATVTGPVLGALVRPARRQPETPRVAWAAVVVLPAAVLTGGTVLGGVGMLTTSLGGLYWLAAAVALALLGGLSGAWVLMIEVVR